MKARDRLVLFWSGMFLLAFVGGTTLGRFVAAGIDLASAPVSETDLTRPTGSRPTAPEPLVGRALASGAPAPAVEAPQVHVCEGCDAAETRYRQMAQAMGFWVEPVTEEDTEPLEAVEAPPLPQLPVLRRAQSDAATGAGAPGVP